MDSHMTRIKDNTKVSAVISFRRSEKGKNSKGLSPSGGKLNIRSLKEPKKSPNSTLAKGDDSVTSDGVNKRPNSSSKGRECEEDIKGLGGGGGGGGRRAKSPQQNIASTFVTVLADKGDDEKKQRHKESKNRADKLQITLDDLEEDVSRLKEKEGRLESRLKEFTLKKYRLMSTLDDIHSKLEDLARTHKNINGASEL